MLDYSAPAIWIPIVLSWAAAAWVGVAIVWVNKHDARADLENLLRSPSTKDPVFLAEARGGHNEQRVLLVSLLADLAANLLAILAGPIYLGLYGPIAAFVGSLALIYMSESYRRRRLRLLNSLRTRREQPKPSPKLPAAEPPEQPTDT